MSKKNSFPGFGDYYDLKPLKQYVEENKIMELFTPEEQETIEAMAKELKRLMREED